MNDHPVQWPAESRPRLRLSDSRLAVVQEAFVSCLEEESIDAESSGFTALFAPLYLPMAAWLARQQAQQQTPMVVGLHGGQGAGKSTLSRLLQVLLGEGFDKTVVTLSIDDLYLTRAERQRLAQQVHPLLATRGVPGTHDVELGIDLLAQLKQSREVAVRMVQFDKATDDRQDESRWPTIVTPVDIIFFEGWCVGAVAQAEEELQPAMNELEARQDADGRWRQYVNHQLQTGYQKLFALIDRLIMLKVPSMEQVLQWRLLQEYKLARSLTGKQGPSRLMSEAQLRHFIMHFERLTRASLKEMPQHADVVLSLDEQHRISEVQVRNGR